MQKFCILFNDQIHPNLLNPEPNNAADYDTLNQTTMQKFCTQCSMTLKSAKPITMQKFCTQCSMTLKSAEPLTMQKFCTQCSMTLKSAKPTTMQKFYTQCSMTLKSAEPLTMQKFCTLFNDTQICLTQHQCRNSAPCSMCN